MKQTMTPAGLLIVMEGPDGSGKETQTGFLTKALTQEGHNVLRLDFPTYGDDPVAGLIRTLLREMKDEWNTRSWKSKALLYAANRERERERLERHLADAGNIVLCNRYVPSNQAHMAGYAEETAEWQERFDWVSELEYGLLGLPMPHVVLFHTMPHARRDELLKAREQGKRDAHEEASAYLQRVERCYAALLAQHQDVWRHIPADVDGRVEDPGEIHARVRATLQEHAAWQRFIVRSTQYSKQSIPS